MHLYNLKCCGQESPLQLAAEYPVFSWMICGEGKYEVRQISYHITVTEEDGTLCWDSGKVDSEETLQILYEGTGLKPDTCYIWKVSSTVISSDGEEVLARESRFETGLLRDSWKAKWIGYDALPEGMKPFDRNEPFYCADEFQLGENQYYLPPAPYLRREFENKKEIKKAELYVSAQGIADVSINGEKVTTDKFVPGTANYDTTVWCRCYDVTSLIRNGANAAGVILADGWYAGYMGLQNREWYGSKPRVMVQLVLTATDGTKETIVSDENWKASYGAVLEADIFQGECFDARKKKETAGFDLPGYDDSKWNPVETGTEHDVIPTAHPGVPMKEYEEFEAKEITAKDGDTAFVDLGKLISGVLRITVEGPEGKKLHIRHSEILGPDGELHLDGNRSARAEDIYICSGAGKEIFKPEYTYHGFRYAKITGLTGVKLLKAEGIAIGSDFPDQTEFYTSNDTINDVFAACRDTMRTNLMDNPTDVCARDERLGWGMEGDHATASVAMLGNMEGFIRKWNCDIWSAQHENGALEPIAPPLMMKDIEQFIGDLQTNHGIRMIYTLYKLYGDRQIIRDHYPAMEKFFDYLDHNSDRCIRFGTTGDWLNIWELNDHSDVNHGYGDSSPGIIGTTHYAIIIRMMIEMSEAIGKTEEAGKYRELFEKVKKVFGQNFIQRDGTIRFGKQGDYVLALAAGMVPEEYQQLEAQKLREKLTEKGKIFWRGGTPSTPYFLGTLKKYGMAQEAESFLASREFPSIGYMIDKGPGTAWERWDGIWEDGTLHPQVMNAMSHIGLTVVDEYLVTGLAGITPVKAGFHTFKLNPAVTEGLKELETVYHSKSGAIKVHWFNEKKQFKICFTVPANTQAMVTIPCKKEALPETVKGRISEVSYENGTCSFLAGSGEYEIIAAKP